MFVQSKEGKQYSFSIELSLQEVDEQTFAETITFFDNSLHKASDVKEIAYNETEIPASIFREGNNGLRAIVRYLKDEKQLSFADIARMLSRDQRTVWNAYASAKKIKQKTPIDKNSPLIKTSIFSDRNLSILESAAMHLLLSHSVKETAQILGRNQMTIWTVKRRAEQKYKAGTQNESSKTGRRNRK